jgi:hypothetical protein
MAREWEVPEEANTLDYADNPWIVRYSDRRYQIERRKFHPEQLTKDDMRSGVNRRYMRGYNKYLQHELRLRNNLEGLY